jgi:hypothetical protein
MSLERLIDIKEHEIVCLSSQLGEREDKEERLAEAERRILHLETELRDQARLLETEARPGREKSAKIECYIFIFLVLQALSFN